jgi:hypothetical protein
MTFRNYQAMRENFSNPRADRSKQSKRSMRPFILILGSTAANIWALRDSVRKRPTVPSGPRTLGTLLQQYRPLQCQSFHDKVYALASLATDDTIAIDYSISSAELLSRVWTTVLKRGSRKPFQKLWQVYAADCEFDTQSDLALHAAANPETAPKVKAVPYRASYSFSIIRIRDWNPTSTSLEDQMLEMKVGAESREAGPEVDESHKTQSEDQPRLEIERSKDPLTCKVIAPIFRMARTSAIPTAQDHTAESRHSQLSSADHKEVPEQHPPQSHESQGKQRQHPLIFTCCDSSRSTPMLGFTWAEALIGDGLYRLSHLAEDCYAILREKGDQISVVGPAWVTENDFPHALAHLVIATLPAEQRHPEQACEQLKSMAEEQGSPFDGTPSGNNSKDVVLSNVPAAENGISTNVTLHFNFWELLNLLQTEADMAKVKESWWRADGARRRADRDEKDLEAAEF